MNGDLSAFAKALSREKLLRMVRRDRSHPSLVIYNMINEAWDSGGAGRDQAVFDGHVRDMRDAHALDPSRVITHTSAWAKEPEADEPPKMHMLPFDDAVHMHGWYDFHHAGGPEVWRQSLYRSPDDYYNRTDNRKEIVFWGEEGAISSPPRLELIKTALDAAPRQGWDGPVYLDWYRRFDDFLSRKNLRTVFPTVDTLTTALGKVSHYHQGRKIETIRVNDVADGYAVNGWEAELVENHSGIVDCFRNPKADPAIMAYYNDGARLWVNGKQLFDDLAQRRNTMNRGQIALDAGQAVPIRLELWHGRGDARCKMSWAPPEAAAPNIEKLMERVRKDGTTLLILDRADTWMDLLQKHAALTYGGSFRVGTAWLGGLHFVRQHPLFDGLPVNAAMDWPYQAVVANGKVRSGLLIEGEELVAGAWHSYPMALGTAVGVIPCGRGRIVVSTLDIAGALQSPDTSAHVARKLLCNFVAFGRKRP